MSQTNIKPAVFSVAEATDIHWHDIDQDAIILVDCHENGCLLNGTPHMLTWGDLLQHKAFTVSDRDTLVEVIKYAASEEIPEAESCWIVAGYLCDDDTPLTPARVASFNANYNSAVALASELNEDA
ncbi:hypothetical protein [Curtobacterium sp. PhB136]|uniref:hypothetical protein n=1 Tax=Curtobacterium sp. PhB136 TaxID=2485181 RepID=UPI00104F7482|nr:hypothetical protein [Curtobacterium sp. PhB136]TCK63618.1 hypothetical protein EDF27_2163 [Curtobacterium sp. PhB136]